MRGVYLNLLTAGLLVLAASPAFAQPPGGGRFGGNQPLSLDRLLNNKDVLDELKLSDDQKADVKKAADTVSAKYRDQLDAARGDREKRDEVRKAESAELDKAVAGVLKPEQLKRAKQLQVQLSPGLTAFSIEDVQTALKLTDKQKDDVKDEEKGLQDDIRDLMQSAGMDPDKRADALKKVQTMRADSLAKIVNGLSADQKKTWQDLTGEKTTIVLQPGGGGFGPGAGGPGGGFGGGFGGMARAVGAGMLLRSDKVATELKLTDDQKSEVQKAGEKIRDKFRDEMDSARGDREKMAELFKQQGEALDKELAGILKPEQTKRLNQIKVQVGGLAAFATEDVQNALKLTDAQKKEVKEAEDAVEKDMQDAFQGAFQGGFDPAKLQEIGKKVQTMRTEALDKVLKDLTDEQKKTYKELAGDKFELDLQDLFRGNRPGGPRPPNPNQ